MLSKNIAYMHQPSCVACGTCIKACPRGAVTVYKGCYATVTEERCVGCGKCAKVCPAGCIEIGERAVVK